MSDEQREAIYPALVAIQGDITAVGKDTKSPNLRYTYRAADDVTAMLHPLLVKHGVTCVPIVQSQQLNEYSSASGNRMLHVLLMVAFRYYASDGSYVEATTIGEGADSSDKSCNKAMTQARKAADCLVFTIPTGDDDPEHDRPSFDGLKKKASPPPYKSPASAKRDSRGRPLASEKQKKMLYAVSMKRAETLIEERIQTEQPMKYEDQNALRGSIAKHAALSVGIDGEIHGDEIDALRAAIESATINDQGETVIPSEPF